MTRIKKLLLLFLITAKSVGFCQNVADRMIDAQIAGATRIVYNDSTNTISYVGLSEEANISEQNHLLWLKNNVLLFSPSEDFRLIRKESDQYGYTHYRYLQVIQNVPVEHGVYYVHCKNGKVISANGEAYRAKPSSIIASISKELAFNRALKALPSNNYNSESGGTDGMKQRGELVWYKTKVDGLQLCYKFDIYSIEPLNRLNVFISAVTGEKLGEESRIHYIDSQGHFQTTKNGTNTITTDSVGLNGYRLRANKGFGGISTFNLSNSGSVSGAIDFYDADNTWDSQNNDSVALDVHFGMEASYDFFYQKFGRNSYDNNSAPINAFVHYTPYYNTSLWDGSHFVFGDSYGELAIVGHEYTHAIIDNSAGLVSNYLTESLSDCFGVAIDYYKHPLTANYLIGEQTNANGTPIRNMGNPKQEWAADCYYGINWEPYVNHPSQYGVMNYWFYLISNGGSGTNDFGSNYSITGIGIDKTIQILYRTLTIYLTPNSNYEDMSDFSIQAAEDIFGSCSIEKHQVQLAWSAVGLKNKSTNFSVNGESEKQVFECSAPVTISFNNESTNGTTYFWDFGDGNTSQLQNPTHTYLSAGSYSVKLIKYGSSICNGVDSIIKTNFINVHEQTNLKPAQCFPTHSNIYALGKGIVEVKLGSIDNTTNQGDYLIKDYSCQYSTESIEGDPIHISLGIDIVLSNTKVKVWIDYNNNGVFENNTELIYSGQQNVFLPDDLPYSFSGLILPPSNVVLDTGLRVRIISYINEANTACSVLDGGDSQDYQIIFRHASAPPHADFVANNTSPIIGEAVKLTNLSTNGAKSFVWSFPGGTPSSSIQKHPQVIYYAAGIYPVTLTVSNSFGTDSITKTEYITVYPSFNLCGGTYTSNLPYGKIYDSGGMTQNYTTNNICNFTITPGCNQYLELFIDFLETETSWDILKIYDGTNNTSSAIAQLSGTRIPDSSFLSRSGSFYIEWKSDATVNYSGFQIHWKTRPIPNDSIVANFSISSSNSPLNVPIQFKDSSTNNPTSWQWNFGDGGTESMPNPTHNYLASGVYIVKLIASNCHSTDTIVKTVSIQAPPILSFDPDTIYQNLNCSDSTVVSFKVKNLGAGDLILNPFIKSDSIKILWVNSLYDPEYLFQNFRDTILLNFPNSNISKYFGTDPNELELLMEQNDILILPIYNSKINFSDWSTALNKIASSGKTIIIFNNDGSGSYNQLFNTGLFTGKTLQKFYNYQLSKISKNVVSEQLPNTFNDFYTFQTFEINDPDIIPLFANNKNQIVHFLRQIGLGRAICFGNTYQISNSYLRRMVRNSIESTPNKSKFAILDTLGQIVIAPGDSMDFHISFNSEDLNSGIRKANVIFNSNDPSNVAASIPVYLNVIGNPNIELSSACINFDSVYLKSPAFDTLKISNTGCDTLFVSNIHVSNAKFTVSDSVFNVPPNKTFNLKVVLNTDVQGLFADSLTIINNVKDTSICLIANVLNRPILRVNPEKLSVAIDSCQNIVTRNINFYNDGNTNITFNLDSITNDSVRVLAHNIYYNDNLSTIRAYISSYYENFSIEETATFDSTTLRSKLSNIDVLLFTSPGSSLIYNYSSLKSVVTDFLKRGGHVILFSDWISGNNRLRELGLFNTSYLYSSIRTAESILPSDSLALNMPSSFICNFSANVMAVNDSDVTTVLTSDKKPMFFYRPIGNGKAIYLGLESSRYLPETYTAIGNAVRKSLNFSQTNWLSFNQNTISIAPGDSQQILATFDLSNVSNGNYRNRVFYTTNDPIKHIGDFVAEASVTDHSKINFNVFHDSCSSQVVFYSYGSTNSTTFLWDFGDGTTSNVKNPTHVYGSTGYFTVKLIAYDASYCGGVDSVVKANVVNIESVNSNLSNCWPKIGSYMCSGILNVSIGSINNSSSESFEGNKDFTCISPATFTIGDNIPISITTSGLCTSSKTENVKVWIDYNNDQVYDNVNELAFSSNQKITNHSGCILNTANAVLSSDLRMRVVDNTGNYPITGPCDSLQSGQAEDYLVRFEPNSTPPIASFIANKTEIKSGDSVSFTDISTGANTSWTWDFQGGFPSNSSSRNPIVTYPNVGIYPVKLIVTNSFGIDSIIKTSYINVLRSYTMCTSTSSSSDKSGFLFDSGGPNGNYSNNENCTFTIHNDCMSEIELVIDSMNTEYSTDGITVFDGSNSSGTVIAKIKYQGANFKITATSGSMFISWNSNSTTNYFGFAAHWTSKVIQKPQIIADFSVQDTIVPLNFPVSFTDLSDTTANQWYWDFGDGNYSTLKNPSHVFNTTGFNTITLIANNCSSSDTIIKTIYVQKNPLIAVTPGAISTTINCHDSVPFSITVFNHGFGDLEFQPGGMVTDTIKILVIMAGVDSVVSLVNTINAISQGVSPVKFTKYYGTDPNTIISLMNSNDVLLFPAQFYYSSINYSSIGSAVNQIAFSGKTVIVCGSTYTSNRIFDMNLFSGSFWNYTGNQTLNTIGNDPLLSQVNTSFYVGNHLFIYNVNSSNLISIIKAPNSSTLNNTFYRKIGKGKAINIGFDFASTSTDFAKILLNSIYASTKFSKALNFTIGNYQSVQSGSSSTLNFVLNASSLDSGVYSGGLVIYSNDTLHPVTIVPITISINQVAGLTLNKNCINLSNCFKDVAAFDTIKIVNTGCIPLIISNVNFSNSNFYGNVSSFSVKPDSTFNFIVNGNTTSIGSYSGTVTLFNNVHDTTICLTSFIQDKPTINIAPNIMNFNLGVCDDSVSIPFYIYNTGLAPLQFSLHEENTDTIRLLAFYGGSYLGPYGSYVNTFKALDRQLVNYTIDSTNTSDSLILKTKLRGKDVLVFTSAYTVALNNYVNLKTVINDFVNSGGCVIFCSDQSNIHRMTTLGLFNATYPTGIVGGDTNTVVNNDSLILNVQNTFISPPTTWPVKFSDANIVNVAVTDSGSTIAYKKFGLGKLIYLGFDYAVVDTVNATVLGNAIRNNVNTFKKYSNIIPSSGIISVADSQLVYAILNVDSFPEGNYNYNYWINSNDVVSPISSLSINVSITNIPCAYFTYLTDECSGEVIFTNTTINASSYLWDFGDGTSSVDQSPTHIYALPGNYTITLLAFNLDGTDTLVRNISVSFFNTDFTINGVLVNGQQIQFNCTNQGATSFDWDFGDGFLSSQNPENHIYNIAGDYTVTCVASNGICTDTLAQVIHIGTVGISTTDLAGNFQIFPNPFQSSTLISYELTSTEVVSLKVYDIAGRVVKTFCSDDMQAIGPHQFNFISFVNGVYFVELKTGSIKSTKKIISVH